MPHSRGDITMLEALRLGLNDDSGLSKDAAATDEIDINAVSNSSWISDLLGNSNALQVH